MGGDTFSFGGLPIITSPHLPDGIAIMMQDGSLAGRSADFVIHDEWGDLDNEVFEDMIDHHEGVLRREAAKILAEREAAAKRAQEELEATPGFGSF